jgi:hypothetical protein
MATPRKPAARKAPAHNATTAAANAIIGQMVEIQDERREWHVEVMRRWDEGDKRSGPGLFRIMVWRLVAETLILAALAGMLYRWW